MKIKPEYSIDYTMDDITILKTEPDGTVREVSPISASAALAWEGFQFGRSREAIIESIVTEFTGTSEELVAEELDDFAAQLIAMGYAEE